MRRLALALALACAAGPWFACAEDLGPCDEELARSIYYSSGPDALPAYGGQAQVQRSCGGGAFCHSEAAVGEARFGAPAGLDFDLALASSPAQTQRLRRGQRRVYDLRHRILSQVEEGSMPPGEAGRNVLALGASYEGLPSIDTPEGVEVLRGWLACGSPVVERTGPRPAETVPVGDVVPLGPGAAGR